MKQLIIILIILIIIFGGAMYIQKFLNDSSSNIVSKLEEIKKDIQEGEKEGNIQNKTEEMYEEWENVNERWSIIVLHDEIDLIETSLIRMKSKIKTGNLEESMEDLDSSIFLLNHIKEKEKTSLKNIF